MAALEVRDVSVRFGGLAALNGVSFAVEDGTVTGLIGPNGAGKTTCFNVITGLQACTTGQVVLEGTDISRMRPYKRARLGIGRTFQRLETFRTLTARENVLVAAEMARGDRVDRTRTPAQITDAILERVGIAEVAEECVEQLPTGTQRLVELGRALASSPKVLLLDEPSSGLDDDETDTLGTLLRELAAGGLAVLLVEHDMPFIMDTCSTIQVLDFGSIIATGGPAEVQQNPLVRTAYLGEEREPSVAAAPAVIDVRVVHDVTPPPVETANGSSASPDHVTPSLELRDIRAGYGLIDVIEGLSLSVPSGSVLAVLGPNGAGKSTMLKVASGQVTPNRGDVLLLGQRVTGKAPEVLVRRGLCCVPEGRSIFPNLTVAENLLMCTHSGVDIVTIEEQSYARFPRLGERRQQLAGTLSGGEQQMLAMARALSTNPKVLLLDELSMGLAPLVVEQLYQTVARIAEGDVAIVIVEQFAHDVLEVAQQAIVMSHGRIVMRGSPTDVAAGMDAAYFGLDRTAQ